MLSTWTKQACCRGRHLFRQRAHDANQVRFALETNAGQLRHRDVAMLNLDAVGEAAVGLKEVGVALVAAEAEAGGNIQRHLVAAMWNAARGGPTGRSDY